MVDDDIGRDAYVFLVFGVLCTLELQPGEYHTGLEYLLVITELMQP
jgi:hypothetical protein